MKIALVRADGGVSIMAFAPGMEGFADKALADWEKCADPSWLPLQAVQEIADADIPKDRSKRDKWHLKAGKIEAKP